MDRGQRSTATDLSLSSIPIDILLAELAKRKYIENGDSKPQCGSGKQGAYDPRLHVFALVLILGLSTLACSFPLISSHSHGRRQSRFIFYSQHFGTGVLIATAFIHLLPTAFTTLTDPCLPYFFREGYPSLSGLIAMVSALVVVAIESYLTTHGAGHSHSHRSAWNGDDLSEDGRRASHVRGSGGLAARRGSSRPAEIALGEMAVSEGTGLMSSISPVPDSTPTTLVNDKEHQRDQMSLDKSLRSEDQDEVRESLDLELNLEEIAGPLHRAETRIRPGLSKTSTTSHVPSPEEQKRLIRQCLLLEAGILFHSIFVGMAISVATGPSVVVFLVAIAFHQTFEGVALGSRIAALGFPKNSPRPWLMVLAYGTTTPIGQAIGLGVHKFYDPQSQTGLLMVGLMNAISSGLLLFAGLVQLLAEDFLTEKSYKMLKGRTRVNAFVAVAGGAGLMAAVRAF